MLWWAHLLLGSRGYVECITTITASIRSLRQFRKQLKVHLFIILFLQLIKSICFSFNCFCISLISVTFNFMAHFCFYQLSVKTNAHDNISLHLFDVFTFIQRSELLLAVDRALYQVVFIIIIVVVISHLKGPRPIWGGSPGAPSLCRTSPVVPRLPLQLLILYLLPWLTSCLLPQLACDLHPRLVLSQSRFFSVLFHKFFVRLSSFPHIFSLCLNSDLFFIFLFPSLVLRVFSHRFRPSLFFTVFLVRFFVSIARLIFLPTSPGIPCYYNQGLPLGALRRVSVWMGLSMDADVSE